MKRISPAALVLVMIATSAVGLATPATAAPSTMVSLTFDDNTASQFTLAYQQVLQPNGVTASFFVDSGTIGSSTNFMTWAQVAALALAGNDIGGKTVHGVNRKTSVTATKIREVATSHGPPAHGLDARTFATPSGVRTSRQGVVRSCGYGRPDLRQPVAQRAAVRGDDPASELLRHPRIRSLGRRRPLLPAGLVSKRPRRVADPPDRPDQGVPQAPEPAGDPTCAKGTDIELETLRASVTGVATRAGRRCAGRHRLRRGQGRGGRLRPDPADLIDPCEGQAAAPDRTSVTPRWGSRPLTRARASR